jgi:hypothetical protein
MLGVFAWDGKCWSGSGVTFDTGMLVALERRHAGALALLRACRLSRASISSARIWVSFASPAVLALPCQALQPTLQSAGSATAGSVAGPPPAPAAGASAPALDHGLPRPDVIAISAPLPGFMKGLKLGNSLDAPSEGAWGATLSEQQFERAAAAGFDHVRLPVRFSSPERADVAPPYTIRQQFFQRVDWAIDGALLSAGARADAAIAPGQRRATARGRVRSSEWRRPAKGRGA